MPEPLLTEPAAKAAYHIEPAAKAAYHCAMNNPHLTTQIDEIRALLRDKLGLRGKDLQSQLARAGRSLPRQLQNQAKHLVTAQALTAHPRLSRQIDQAQVDLVDLAHKNCTAFLRNIDKADRRKGKILSVLGAISFNLIVVVTILVSVLVWRGLI